MAPGTFTILCNSHHHPPPTFFTFNTNFPSCLPTPGIYHCNFLLSDFDCTGYLGQVELSYLSACNTLHLIRKDPDAGKDWRQEAKRTTEDEDDITDSIDMSLGKLQGDGEGQGSLACCSSWSRKELVMTEQLSNKCILEHILKINLYLVYIYLYILYAVISWAGSEYEIMKPFQSRKAVPITPSLTLSTQ